MEKNKAAILALVGCCSYMFVIGCLYLWGNISLYITSYFRLMEWNVYESDLVFYLVIRALIMLVLVPYSAFWVKQYGTNKLDKKIIDSRRYYVYSILFSFHIYHKSIYIFNMLWSCLWDFCRIRSKYY